MEAGAVSQAEAVLEAVAAAALEALAVEASAEAVLVEAGSITHLIYLFLRNNFSIFQLPASYHQEALNRKKVFYELPDGRKPAILHEAPGGEGF